MADRRRRRSSGSRAASSGAALYFLAGFGVYSVVIDVFLRRRAGVAVLADRHRAAAGAGRRFLLIVPSRSLVYVASWTGWFATDGGYYRHWVEEAAATPGTALLSWVPLDVQNWWHYQVADLQLHVGEHTPHALPGEPAHLAVPDPADEHVLRARPGWHDVATILDIANPLIWWAGDRRDRLLPRTGWSAG